MSAVAALVGYCDFDVAVSRVGDGFEVRVLGSPAGETRAIHVAGPAPAAWPAVDQSVTREPARDVGAAIARSADREQVGKRLFDLLFCNESLVRFRDSQHRAAAASRGLRVVLRAGRGADDLPWELLYDASSRRFLVLDPSTPVVRCIEMPTHQPVPALAGPLRMVVAVATPAGSPGIDAGRELRDLSLALDPFVTAGVLELIPLLDATLDGIRRAVSGDDVHILHYIGHGSRSADGRGVLELGGAGGAVSARTGDELGAVLAAAPALRLVVLNCCHGAAGADDDPFAGPAAALVSAGVPAVLAMRHTIGDRSAIELSRTFYAQLVDGARVERALTTARLALYTRDDPSADDWPVASLYLGSSIDSELTASPLTRIDEDVQVTVARPAQLRSTQWESMLVFGHPSGPYVSAAGATVDPHDRIEQRVASFFGADADRIVTLVEDARSGVPRGAGLVVVPEIADVECSPPQASMTWAGELEEVRFLLRAGAHREGTTVEGSVRVFCGALVIAEAAVEFAVVSDSAAPAPLSEQAAVSYRRIFPCFSPRDVELVAGFAAVAEALGDRFTADVIAGRSDDTPDEWMLPLIEQADVFQLFWSTHSMQSASCRRQWEAALATRRPGFIRPLYWEHPFPRAPGLPPRSLESLRFIRVPMWTERTTTQQLWHRAPPTPRPPAAVTPSVDPSGAVETVPPPSARRAGAGSGALGVAGVFGLLAAVVAALVTASVPGGGTTPVPTTSPDVPPPVPPGGDPGSSTLVVVAVAVGAFVLVFMLTLFVVRWRRRR